MYGGTDSAKYVRRNSAMYSAPDGETYFRMPALPAFVRLGEERNGGATKGW
jgi:hypothetical protein